MSVQGIAFNPMFEIIRKKDYEDVLTPYNITILAMIKGYFDVRVKLDFEDNYNDNFITGLLSKDRVTMALFIRDCMLNPEVSFTQLMIKMMNLTTDVVTIGHSEFLKNLRLMAQKGLNFMLSFLKDTDKFLLAKDGPRTRYRLILKTSVVGFFLRRIVVTSLKMTLPQSIRLFRLYERYYQKGLLELYQKMSRERMNAKLSHILSQLSDPNYQAADGFDNKLELVTWSKKQTDLFLANQEALLTFNENAALPPFELTERLKEILHANPAYPQVYYIFYLNCLRLREYNVGLEFLMKYLDSICLTTKSDDKMRSFRYAALTLGIFHSVFGNKKLGMWNLSDSILLSQSADDSKCLLSAYVWQRYVSDDKQVRILSNALRRLKSLCMNAAYSISLQSYAREFVMNGYCPDTAFLLMTQSDIVNYKNMMYDLIFTSFSNRALVWGVYGSQTMMFVTSQIMLTLNLPLIYDSIIEYNTEATATTLCNCALYMLNEGRYGMASNFLNRAQGRFPLSCRKWYLYTMAVINYEHAISAELWTDAEEAVLQISAIDEEEGLLRKGRLYNEMEDRDKAVDAVKDLIYRKNISPVNKVRAYLTLVAASVCSRVTYLQQAFVMATRLRFSYLLALVKLEMARLQYDEGMSTDALSLLEQCQPVLFSENMYGNQAKYYMLHSQCLMSSCLNIPVGKKKEKIREVLDMLNLAKALYQRLGYFSNVKYVLYLQTIYAHVGGEDERRNSYAFEFRQLHEENPTSKISSCSFD